jgi:hypothetical protein
LEVQDREMFWNPHSHTWSGISQINRYRKNFWTRKQSGALEAHCENRHDLDHGTCVAMDERGSSSIDFCFFVRANDSACNFLIGTYKTLFVEIFSDYMAQYLFNVFKRFYMFTVFT